jgi:hypothetical protein
MAVSTYYVILNAKGNLKVNGKSNLWGQATTWDKINKLVNDFNSATTTAAKAAALQSIKRVISENAKSKNNNSSSPTKKKN